MIYKLKIKLSIFAIASVIITSCSGQKAVLATSTTATQPQQNTDIVTKYMNTITADEWKTHVYIVASDEMQGRNTGEEGQ